MRRCSSRRKNIRISILTCTSNGSITLRTLAREHAADAGDAGDVITALNSVMFDVLGFRGNRENYYDPRNSFLNQVIDRRTGIPITMTVVYIEVARRIGFPVKGVGMPFHFIAKHEAESGDIFIDPFNEGKVLGVPVVRSWSRV